MKIRYILGKNALRILVIILPLFSTVIQAEPIRVGMLCPAPEKDFPFWGSVVNVMRAAAKDLNIDLIVSCSRHGSLATKRAGDALLKSKPPLDYFISGYWPAITKQHLAKANSNAIKTILINSRVRQEEQAEFGIPRSKFKHWISHLTPNDKQAAIDLTTALVEALRNSNATSERIEIAALINSGKTAISLDRAEGLRMQAKTLHVEKLHKIVNDYWIADWASRDINNQLSKNAGINIIWGGNEASAWGGLLGSEKAGRNPGKDIFVGGFDWNTESLKAIEDGRMSASVFGHYMEGAWALILAHDYHHGFDFIDDTGVSISTPLTIMTPENVAKYKIILEKDYWNKVDFRQLSKKYNPELRSYNFSIDQFLD